MIRDKWRLNVFILFFSLLCTTLAVSVNFGTSVTLGSTTVRAETTFRIAATMISVTTSESLRFDFTPTARNRFNIVGTSVTWAFTPNLCTNLGTVPPTPTCTYQSASNQLTVTLSADTAGCVATLQFSNYINNEYVESDTVNARGIDSGGVTQSTRTITLTYTAATMTSVTLTPQSLVVSATGELLIAFRVGAFAMSSAFSLRVTFPSRFSTTSYYFPSSGTYTCRNGTSNIATSPSCSATDGGSGVSVVTISNLFSTTIAAADTASVYIASINNPISTATISGISATVLSTGGFTIATLSSTTMTVTTPKSATSFTITFSTPNTVEVYGTNNLYMIINIIPGTLVSAGCRISVVFPSEITFTSLSFPVGFVNGVSYDSSSSTLRNTADVECDANTVDTDGAQFYTKVTGPPQIKETSAFTFSLTTSAGASIATGSTTIPSSSITSGTITSLVFTHISGASTIVQTTTTWKMGLTLEHRLLNPWRIKVTYPSSDFTVSGCTPSNLIGFTLGSTTWAVSGNTITLDGTYDLTTLTVSLEGLTGTNPAAVYNIGSFTANAYNVIGGTEYLVNTYVVSDASFTNPFQATAQTLNSISVAIDTPATNSYTGREDVTYTFTVDQNTLIASGSQIRLTIPTSNCLTMYNAAGTSVSSILLTGLVTSDIPATTDLVFSYNKFKNPRSTNVACGTFTIAITNSAGQDLESGSGGSITVLNANTLSTFQITPTPSSLINGGTASYAISSTANSLTPLVTGDRYFITFPSEIDISSATCTTITCSRDSGRITFAIPATVPSPVAMSVDNLVVQGDFQPITTQVAVSVVTASSESQQISVHSSTTVPTTSVAGTLTEVSLVQASYVASTATTYTFNFKTANKIPVGGVILIANTPALTFSLTGGCTTAAGNFGICTFVTSANGVQVPVTTEIPAGTAVSVSIASYTNPTLPVSTSFTAQTFKTSSRTYRIDEVSTGMSPSLECDAPCKTCVSGAKSTCTSCFTTEPSITQKYYTATANTCTNSWGSAFSQVDASFTCEACNTNCLTCAAGGGTNVDTCLTCSGTNKLYSGTCYSSCSVTPVATFESGTNCVACNTSCKTCSTVATQCTSCDTTNLYLNACIATCPATTTAVANVCQSCVSPCNECSGSTSTCTSWDTSGTSTAPILHLSTCLASCPAGYINSGSNTCTRCTSPCATCSSLVTNWVTCDSGFFLDGATCVSSCGTDKVEISGTCFTCQGGWATCTISRTQCTSWTSPLLLHNQEWLSSCPTGYEANTAGTACSLTVVTTPTDTTTPTTTTTTTTTSGNNYSLIYFPFLFVAIFLFIISIIGWAKDPRSLIPTVFIALLSILQFLYYAVQAFHAYRQEETNTLYLTAFALVMLIVLNMLFAMIFWCMSWRDQNFKYWANSYCKTKWVIQLFGFFISFKFMRMYYSWFFGLEHFWAGWEKPMRYVNVMICFSLLSCVTCWAPVIFIDVIGLMTLSWGSQLYITMIETLALELLMVLFILIEICTTRGLDKRDEYKKVAVEPNMSFLEDGENEMEKKMRADALKRILTMLKGNSGFMPNNNIEDCVDEDGKPKRRNSLPAPENERDELSDRPHSYPLSPRTRKDMENPLINPLALGFDRDDDFFEPQDNVYAESKPPDPLARVGKSYQDGDTQTFVVGGDHDIPFRDDDSDDGMNPRNKGKAGRGRGRRTRFEDKIREENQFMDRDSDDLDDDGELDVIKEEDDMVAAGITSDRKNPTDTEAQRKLMEDELRRKIEEEDNQLMEEEKRLATNKTDDDFIKEAEEELSKSKSNFHSPPGASEKAEGLDDSDVKLNASSGSAAKMIDGMQIPPDPEKRTFNENDIKGELERNEEGKLAPSTLPNGVMIDKYGRKVNEKGYLVNDKGDIIDNKTNKEMFEKEQLAENGEIPHPFKLERYNFNPHDIIGAFPLDRNGKPRLHETPDGKLVDDSGRQVNEKGILIDEEGNVIDKYGRKKLDKVQLTNKGDIPPMLNYNGKQFRIQDVMGEFDKDPRGDIILERNPKGQLIDKKGRLVNDKGYLVDEDGNIVDGKGDKLWDKEHLHENEFPKIFPFSTFNPESITGNFKRDSNGNPILKPAGKPGQFLDNDGKLVNSKGYFINPNGDIIDKNGNLVFKKGILKDGEIPPVFRQGLIRQDSTTSLSRLMSEIDKNQDSDLDILKDQLEDFDEEEKGNTSVDSLMEDTPSNYNIANQRFDETKYRKAPDAKYEEDEEDYYEDGSEGEEEEYEENEGEDNDSITGPAGVPILNARQPKKRIVRKKKKKRRKKKVKMVYEDPTAADQAMARAYGGEARGKLVKKVKRKLSGRSNSSRASRNFSKPARRDQFFKGGSVSGRDPKGMINTLRSNESRSGVPKAPGISSKKSKKRKPRDGISKMSGSEYEKMYDKNLDEFLENSDDYDFESIGPPSRTMSRQGSARGGGKLKGLESIYLQRLEANPAKGKKGKSKKRRKDNQGNFLGSELSDNDDLGGLMEENYRRMKKKFAPMSARSKKGLQGAEVNTPNIFTGNYTKYTKDHKPGDGAV